MGINIPGLDPSQLYELLKNTKYKEVFFYIKIIKNSI